MRFITGGSVGSASLREHEIFLGKLVLDEVGKFAVGPRTYFSGHQTIKGEHPVVFGAFCSVAEGLYLNSTPDFHAMKTPSTYEFHAEPRDPANTWNMGFRNAETEAAPSGIVVGHAVWIGRNARVFHGAEIGNGCVVAEGSLVRGKLEAYGVLCGCAGQTQTSAVFRESHCQPGGNSVVGLVSPSGSSGTRRFLKPT